MLRCSLLAVGDELLDGRVSDTNSDFITDQMQSMGIRIVLRINVGDDIEHIAGALRMAMGTSDMVVMTGGLGPTEDDLTREAVARTLGLELRRDTLLEERLKGFFVAMGRVMSPTNLKQADLVEGATPITARLGTAPGQWLEKDGCLLVMIPGVPREMRDMISGDVIPLVAQRFSLQESTSNKTLLVAARPESELAEQVQEALTGMLDIKVAYRAMMGQIELKLSAENSAALEEAERRIREALGPWVVAEGGETLEGNLGRELRSREMSIAVAESLTGGMVGERITSVPGSSDYFKGGVVAYNYEVKEDLLGLDPQLLASHGAVNVEAAGAMAEGVRERLSSDLGLALTGVAGPERGRENEPPGTVVFGLADESGTYGWKYRLPGDREMVRQFATTVMLAIAYFYVRGEEIKDVR
ncbi:MAG: CinA family nicotinamide mononucleotide deamidase-related protein [Actinobacteria bacterium]|nr:CinA family nicotinamide mononucleotide deamidase-related protein [Actinomycetota bacterium]